MLTKLVVVSLSDCRSPPKNPRIVTSHIGQDRLRFFLALSSITTLGRLIATLFA